MQNFIDQFYSAADQLVSNKINIFIACQERLPRPAGLGYTSKHLRYATAFFRDALVADQLCRRSGHQIFNMFCPAKDASENTRGL